MTIESTAVLLIFTALAGAVIVLGVLLVRRAPAPAREPDAAALHLQQEISRLAGQVALIGAQVPRDVGATLQQVTGQMAERFSENSRLLQKASADTGQLIADISVRLGELGRSSQEILALGQDIRGLQQIFQAPKVRGGLGEIALASLLQQTFPLEHFSIQHAFQDGLVVDAVLRLPGGLVPIDSKFPLSGFRLILEATTPEQRDRARRQFAREVRRHVDDIAQKYIRPSEGTLDFALMYVPAENVYYELIAREPGDGEDEITAYSQKRRVIPVSPNSIHAYLQAIAYGLMGLRIERRAAEVLKGLQQLSGDYGTFRETLNLALKHLRNAQAAFAEADRCSERLGDKIQQFNRLAATPEEEAVGRRSLDA